jgi:hypothetical protein
MPSQEDLKAAAEALARGEVRKEITKEDDLKNVMRQIQQLEQSKALTDGDSGERDPTAEQAASSQPPLAQSDAPIPSAAPASFEKAKDKVFQENDGLMRRLAETPKAPPPAPPWLHNIVQVISKEGRHFGRIFQLGDIKDGKAHGYYIKEHGDREYVTVPADHIAMIGPARIRLKQPCSDKWVSDHMEGK